MRTKFISKTVTPDIQRDKVATLIMTSINLPNHMFDMLKQRSMEGSVPMSVLIRTAIVEVYGDSYVTNK